MNNLFNFEKLNSIGQMSFLDMAKEDAMETLRFYMFSGDWEDFLTGLSEVQKHNAHFLVKEAWEYVFWHDIPLEEIKNYKAE